MWIGIFLTACTVFDLKTRRLPVWLMIMGSVTAVIFRISHWEDGALLWLGGMLTGMFFIAVSWRTGEQVGYGDSWMILILGLYLGLWDVLWLLSIAFTCSGIVAVILLIKGKWSKKVSFPFIPFLMLGYMGVAWL